MMTLTEFAALVQEMREAQIRWNEGYKTQTTFDERRDLEKKVDGELLHIRCRQGVQTAFEFGLDDYEG